MPGHTYVKNTECMRRMPRSLPPARMQALLLVPTVHNAGRTAHTCAPPQFPACLDLRHAAGCTCPNLHEGGVQLHEGGNACTISIDGSCLLIHRAPKRADALPLQPTDHKCVRQQAVVCPAIPTTQTRQIIAVATAAANGLAVPGRGRSSVVGVLPV